MEKKNHKLQSIVFCFLCPLRVEEVGDAFICESVECTDAVGCGLCSI